MATEQEITDLAASANAKTQERKEDTKELCKDMFGKVADYVNGELTG